MVTLPKILACAIVAGAAAHAPDAEAQGRTGRQVYDAAEPKRFVGYFESMAPASAIVLARASVEARE